MDTDADPEASVEKGARRATILPPTAQSRTAAAVDNSERFDDDVLAAAMADETARLGLTGTISIIAPPTTPAASTPVPLPLARSVATGLIPPRTPTGAQLFTVGGLDLPSVDAETALASSVSVIAIPALSLAELPAPSGQPVVLDAESAPAANGTRLPTRRSLRDAELARSREEHVRRSAGPGPNAASAPAPTLAVNGTAPAPEVAISPDFSRRRALLNSQGNPVTPHRYPQYLTGRMARRPPPQPCRRPNCRPRIRRSMTSSSHSPIPPVPRSSRSKTVRRTRILPQAQSRCLNPHDK